MKTTEELDNFLNEFVSIHTAHIFSALFSLSDHTNFTSVIDMLVEGKISLIDIANLDLIDDNAISVFLNNRKIAFNPTVLSTVESNFNAYEYILNTSTYINDYLVSYNLWLNGNVFKNIINNPVRYRVPYITYQAKDGSVYSSLSDFMVKFNNSVLNNILAKKEVTNVSQLIPAYTVPSTGLTTDEKNILARLWTTLRSYFSNVNNTNLYKFIVSAPEHDSDFVTNYDAIHNIINYVNYSDSIENLLLLEIHKLANIGRGYTSVEYDTILNELKLLNYNGMINLTEYMTYIKFYARVINHYKKNNSIAVSDIFINELEKISDNIYKLSDLFKMIMNETTDNLHLLG